MTTLKHPPKKAFLLQGLLLSIVAILPGVSASMAGRTDCPCIDPALTSSPYFFESKLVIPSPTAGLLTYNGTQEFGSFCGTWSADIGDTCSLCATSYCYVDPQNCAVANYPTDYFPTLHLSYSYLTCGDNQAQDQLDQVSATLLKGMTLKYAYPKSSSPWHFTTANGAWSGSVARFFHDLEREAGFIGIRHQVSNTSLSMFQSPWDACVHDVRMGVIDVCVSVVQETDSRRRMSAYATPIMAGAMRLMVPLVDGSASKWNPLEGYDSVWFAWLRPFSTGLWLLTVLAVIAGGMVLSAMETPTRSTTDGDAATPPATATATTTSSSSQQERTSTLKKGATAVAFNFRDGSYNGLVGFVTGGDLGEASTTHAGLVRVGFGMLALILISSYTANLASLLVLSGQTHAGIQSVADCDPPSAKCSTVCVEQNTFPLVAAQHPNMEMVEKVGSWGTMLGLVNGDCDAAVVPEHDVNARRDYQEAMIDGNFIMVGEPIFQVYVGFPARNHLVNALSYHSLNLVYAGSFIQYYEQYRSKKIDAHAKSQGSPDNNYSLTPTDMVGIFTLYCLFFIAAGVLWMFPKERQNNEQPPKEKCEESSEAPPEAPREAPPQADTAHISESRPYLTDIWRSPNLQSA